LPSHLGTVVGIDEVTIVNAVGCVALDALDGWPTAVECIDLEHVSLVRDPEAPRYAHHPRVPASLGSTRCSSKGLARSHCWLLSA
jgi:hypothetical protein